MRNIWTICQKELKSYFTSPIGFLLLALYGFLMGLFFWQMLGAYAFYSLRQQNLNVNDMLIRPMIGNLAVIGVFLLPLITMRLFAEEKRQGTVELLFTSPVTDLQILVGKWLSAVLMYALMVGFASISLMFLFAYGNPDWRPMAVGYLGLLLQGAAMLAIGTFISSTTKNQIIAAAATFVVCLMLWIMDWSASFDSSTLAKVMAYLSINSHMESFTKGTLELRDVVYYLSVIFFGLFLTGRSLESLRWRA
jgi:ABC-2 type transport system permease protein